MGEKWDNSTQAKPASRDGFLPIPPPPVLRPDVFPATVMTATLVYGAQNPGHVSEERQTEACFVRDSRGVPPQLRD